MQNSSYEPPSYEIYQYIPRNFFNKNFNETFIKLIMEQCFQAGKWIKGNPNLFEPDYFYNGSPFEFTIASDRNKKSNFIIRLKTANYHTDNVEKDAFGYIEHQIKVKASKKYCVKNVHLCILCLIDRFEWVSDKYGSCTHFITDVQREKFFNKIRNNYIKTNIFKNIFIIFPDITASWWVWDVSSDHKVKLQLLDFQLKSKKYPFVVLKEPFEKVFGSEFFNN